MNKYKNSEVCNLHRELSAWRRDLVAKLIVTQLVEKFPAFYGPEGSLPSSQQSSTGPYTDPDVSSPHLRTVFL